MGYAVYFETEDRTSYRLPSNPEDITRTDKTQIEQYRVLSGKEIPLSAGKKLAEYSFEAEFPRTERNYTNRGFKDASTWEKMLRSWMENKIVVRFIAARDNGEDVNMQTYITQVKAVEKAGEEGDKYLTISVLEYVAPQIRYVAVQSIRKKGTGKTNPAVGTGKTYTVKSGDSLWAIAKKFYGNGSQYPKIYQANSGKIKNPNLIYPGQILTIP